MMSKSVYISCPISVSESVLDKFADTVELVSNVVARYWVRGTKYDQRYFDTSDAYLFILPGNKFECVSGELPVGLKRELEAAYESGKKIYVGYIARDGSYNIYSAETNGRNIRGIAGTTHDFYNWATTENATTENAYAHDGISGLVLGYALPKYDPITFEEKKAKVDTGNIALDSRLVLMLA